MVKNTDLIAGEKTFKHGKSMKVTLFFTMIHIHSNSLKLCFAKMENAHLNNGKIICFNYRVIFYQK